MLYAMLDTVHQRTVTTGELGQLYEANELNIPVQNCIDESHHEEPEPLTTVQSLCFLKQLVRHTSLL